MDANGDGDFTDDGDTLPDVAPDVAPDVLPDVASTYATINSTGVITASPVQSDVGSGQAVVTVTDQDGTATSQTFYMNVTNVNDAFEMSSGTLSVFGDVYDGETLQAGNTAIITTTTTPSDGATYNAAGNYVFTFTFDTYWLGYAGDAAQITDGTGALICQTGGATFGYTGSDFTCPFTLAAGESATCLLYTSPSPRDE